MVHWVVADSALASRWDSVLYHVLNTGGGYAGTTFTKPSTVPESRWAFIELQSESADHIELAEAIASRFGPPPGFPRAEFVAVNEINSDVNVRLKIGEAANWLGPTWGAKWGAYVIGGGNIDYQVYENNSFVFGKLFVNGAHLFPELYVYYKNNGQPGSSYNYCGGGSDTASRDTWMALFFAGPVPGGATNRMNWLVSYRGGFGNPVSRIAPIFGVADRWVLGSGITETKAQAFLKRVFFIYRNRLPYFNQMFVGNQGGVGSYKWDSAVSVTTRDQAWSDAFIHYCINGNTAALGNVDC